MNTVKKFFTNSTDNKADKAHLDMKLDSMEEAVSTLKAYFKKKESEDVHEQTLPQLGFKVSFCESSKQLKVKVIGARQLPTEFGSGKARGYLIKVSNIFYR